MCRSVGVIAESIRVDFEHFLIDYVHKTQKYGHFSTFWVLQLTSTNWWAILEGKYKDLSLVFHLLLTIFWQIIPVSSTTEAASWWFFSPEKRISSLCSGTLWLCQKNFFLEYVATHSRKLHRSYGRVCINHLGDMDDFVHTQKKIVNNVPRGECLLGKNYHWRGVRTGPK